MAGSWRTAFDVLQRVGRTAHIGKPGHGTQKDHANQAGAEQANDSDQFIVASVHLALLAGVNTALQALAHPQSEHQDKDYKRYRSDRKNHDSEVRIIKRLTVRLVVIVRWGRQTHENSIA